MANKFTQSVLERQYQEAHKRGGVKEENAKIEEKIVSSSMIRLPEQQETIQTEVMICSEPSTHPDALSNTDTIEPMPQSPALPVKRATQVHTAPANLDNFIVMDTERVAKNKTFYLDQAVIDAIKNTAKRQRVTDSKLVNDILRKILCGRT